MVKASVILFILSFASLWALVFSYSQAFAGQDYLTTASVKTQQADLLVSYTDVIRQKKQNPRFIVVDVRNKTAFQQTRIGGSINISLPFIKTKQYLRDMNVVLVNNGYNDRPLLKEAASLNNKGFDVVVLAGGLAVWHQHGGKFAGDLFDLEEFSFVPPQSVLPGKRSFLFKAFIDISLDQNHQLVSEFPDVIHIPVHNKKDLQQLKTVIEKENKDQLSAVLLFNEDGKYKAVASLPQISSVTIFYLKDGLLGYRKAVKQQRAMLNSREQRLKTVGGCPTCPRAEKKNTKSNNPVY